MLERIFEIQGIGILHEANGKVQTCNQTTLIYADNGRGKSTLATILRSVSTNDPSLLLACKTIDGILSQKVVLQFGCGHKVTFEKGTWSEQRPELIVVDADFIGRNVHSGGIVNTDHRRNLLEFALGEAAVSARTDVEKATAEANAAAEKLQSTLGQLSEHHPSMPFAHFEALQPVSEIDKKIAGLQKRLTAASNLATIQAKPIPQTITEPKFDLDGLFEGLALFLDNVHADAEGIVKQHIAKLGGKGAENWLSQGRQFESNSTCPFCDQDVSNNALVKAYQTHFNQAYAGLKNKIAALQTNVAVATAPSVVDGFAKSVKVAAAQAEAWSEHVPTQTIVFDASAADLALAAVRDFVTDLSLRKIAVPLEPLGSAEVRANAATLWDRFLQHVRAANAAIGAAATAISGYKATLSTENTALLKQQVQQLHATKRRYDPAVVRLFAQLATARENKETTERAKRAAREGLDELMTAILERYQTTINDLLKKFGASFVIHGLGGNFRGKAPRSDYGLLLRGKEVPLEGGPPSFATTLSDGDK